jgi:hypothetical protein
METSLAVVNIWKLRKVDLPQPRNKTDRESIIHLTDVEFSLKQYHSERSAAFAFAITGISMECRFVDFD